MEPGRKRLITIGIAAVVAALLIFLAGYLPAAQRARGSAAESQRCAQRVAEMEARLAQTQFDLDVARLRGRLGEVLHEANANNFGLAAQRATAFFDGLQRAMSNPAITPARRSVLQAVLSKRDEISADLARTNQGVKAKLAQAYMQFAAAVP